MRSGHTVRHPELGEGIVIEVAERGGKHAALVNFSYMKEWVSWEELGLASEQVVSDGGPGSGTLIPPPSETDNVRLPAETVDARRAILALKLGQVIQEDVIELSVGTDHIKETIERAVAAAVRRTPGGILFKGAWGSGKTHLLTMLSALAAQHELATASVILDGEGVRLSDPMELMKALLGSLRYPDEKVPVGVMSRFAQLRRSSFSKDTGRRMWRISKAIFETPSQAFDEPEVVEVFGDYLAMSLPVTQAKQRLRELGYRVALPRMNARSVGYRAGRFCELLGEWAEFCASTGARGLVVIFDEVDVEYASTLRASEYEQRRRRDMLLAELRKLLNPTHSLPILLAFGSAPAGGDIEESNDAVLNLKRCIDGLTEVEVPVPDLDQTLELGYRLQSLYARAYPDRTAASDKVKLGQVIQEFARRHQTDINPIPRNFIRGTLERLDVASDLPSYARQA